MNQKQGFVSLAESGHFTMTVLCRELAVTLCESRKASEIAAKMAADYQQATGIVPQIFASRPSLGAHLVG